jgi:hypothetical protein
LPYYSLPIQSYFSHVLLRHPLDLRLG